MGELLKCVGILKRFGDFVATRGIDLTVCDGEMVGIIGANGAGKTTLLNIISGYLRPTAGKLYLRGADVTSAPPRELVRRGVARSFQIPQLFSRQTVSENMMLACALLAEPQASLLQRFHDDRLAERARRVLESYGIDRHARSAVSDVPQGVRKLLDIAMATCAQPDLVLLDEPTSGVSSDEKNDLMQRLAARFTAPGTATTVVFIEHDMEIVRRYASRVIALYDGRIISDGSPEDTFADESVQRFVTGHSRGEAHGDAFTAARP
jgi:branched-chain amino acid transport system ATP-binding protein